MRQRKKRIQYTMNAYSIANAEGEPWTWQAWHTEDQAARYLAKWQADTKIPLPKHRVVPVRATVRFTNATTAALSKRKFK